jgi:hypothetical protein
MNGQLQKAVLICATIALTALPLSAESVSSAAVKGMASAPDAHIRSNSLTNSIGMHIAAPANKGGPKNRGANGTCDVHVNNKTGYYISFYFNGRPAGSMGPWGDLYPNITEGNAELYARAVFDNGTVMTFGPQDYHCTGNDFIWTLTP